MGDEVLPRNTLQSQLIIYQNPDKSKVINIVKLLSRGLVLHEIFHPLYVPIDEKLEVHHLHPGKVHEKPDVIGIKAGKPPLTTEVFHDQFHERRILISQKSEWKNSRELAQIVDLNIGLIMMPLHLLLLMPLFSNFWYACCH